MNPLSLLRERFAAALAGFTSDPLPYAEMVKPAQDARFGDFQANCAMPLAKQVGAKPRDLALQIVSRLEVADLCEPPDVAGPGFINLRLRDDWLAARVSALASDERLGVAPAEQPRTIVVDFSAPNVAKPMHVGHLRSTVIGAALVRILRELGHTVVGDNHIGDWGTQFGMIIYGYKHFRDDAAYQQNPVQELARLYRLVNQLCDYHESIVELPRQREALARREAEAKALSAGGGDKGTGGPADKAKKEFEKSLKKLRREVDEQREAVASLEKKAAAVEGDAALGPLAAAHADIVRLTRQETARLHAGDPENRRLWNEFLPHCLAALQRIYDRLEIRFDITLGESFYDPLLAGVVADLEAKGLATESNGAKCVFLEGNDAPFIIQKGDGAYTYATTDLATIRYRVSELHADEILYVVDHRQSEHFKLLFETARRWGYADVGLRHVVFGTVMGPDGRPYKTRSGDTVGLESLLDEAVAKARQIVAANDDARRDDQDRPAPELSEAQRDAIAEVVGLGGIKYADLKHGRDSDYVFDYDKMLAMTGDTATYMQYAYARLCGIFRKGAVARETLRNGPQAVVLGPPAERALALELCRFEEALLAVAVDARPNQLTQYLFELAGKLTAFYEHCPVLKAEDEATRQSRLRLVDLTGRVIERGLGLLGIGVCEQM
jgi:arginyl-tRNA synthetase